MFSRKQILYLFWPWGILSLIAIIVGLFTTHTLAISIIAGSQLFISAAVLIADACNGPYSVDELGRPMRLWPFKKQDKQ